MRLLQRAFSESPGHVLPAVPWSACRPDPRFASCKRAISYIIFEIMNDATDGFPLDSAARVPFLPVAVTPRASTSRVIADALRTAIVEGTLAPGAPLRQDAIARHFSVSAIPVREALRQLESEGWARVAVNKGATVAPLSARKPARSTKSARRWKVLPSASPFRSTRQPRCARRKNCATPPKPSWTRRAMSPATRRSI